jgi:hypothetical protein
VIILISLNSCSNRTEIKIETKIINDIFLQAIENDLRYPVYPPPPPPQFIDSLGIVNVDSINEKKYRDFISRLDTNQNVFSIEDSTFLLLDTVKIIEILESENLYMDFKGRIKQFVESNENAIPIKISNIKKTGKYNLIFRSKILPKGFNFRKFINPNWTFNYYGNLQFSKPLLDDSGNFGFLVYSKICGFECDKSYLLIIIKEKSTWLILKKIWI